MFYDLFCDLCAKKGVSPTRACTDLGLSNGNLQRWKSGSSPRNSTIFTMSEYFGVSLKVLSGEEEIPAPTDADYVPAPTPSDNPYKAFLSTVALLNEEEIRKLTGYAIALLGER